jgi:hypothetical protein
MDGEAAGGLPLATSPSIELKPGLWRSSRG